MSYRLIVTYRDKPWWGLGLYERDRCYVLRSPPGMTREEVEDTRRLTLLIATTVSVRMEVVDG